MMIFADWGTTNLRAWLLDDQGEVAARHASARGLLSAAELGFAAVFQRVVDELGAEPDTPALIFGMAGSRIGWKEVAYTPTPADAPAIAHSAQPVPQRPNTWIIGGVSDDLDGAKPEVMRGEEVQALGILHLHPDASSICLPGTHTKWIQTESGAIQSFSTFMTGELFSWLTGQSLISTQVQSTAFDPRGFELGCELAEEALPLTSALFQLRTRFLSGAVQAEQVYSMASGLLIGSELAAKRAAWTGATYLCAAPAQAEAYRVAFERFGLGCVSVDPEQAAIAGLLSLSPLIQHAPKS